MTSQKTCLITGASSGLGEAAALQLGALGWDLLLVGRNAARLQRVAERVRGLGGSAEFVVADLSSLAEVRALARRAGERWRSLDVLLNNAGARHNTYGESVDGIERTFAANHLGHFLLTCLLLERLLRAPQGRVINVSSGSHASAVAGAGWQQTRAGYDRRQAYAKSKLANILFTVELAARVSGTHVTVNAADPGGSATRFARNNGLFSWVRHLLAHAKAGDLASARKGAETLVYLAADPAVATTTGKYFREKREAQAAASAADRGAARELWQTSIVLTGLDSSVGDAWTRVGP